MNEVSRMRVHSGERRGGGRRYFLIRITSPLGTKEMLEG